MNAITGTAGMAGITSIQGTMPKKTEKPDEQNDNVVKALKPKFAHSREEMIQNRIDDLREQLSALADAEEIDEKTKGEMRKEINQQISDLNVELLDLRKQRMEKQAEKSEQSGSRSGKYDRYEPSEALKNLSKAASASTALEQAKIQRGTSKKLDGEKNILENEIKLDISHGASAGQKEEALSELKAKLRNADKELGDKLEEAEKDEPTFMTFNTGLLKIEEMRQKALEGKSSENGEPNDPECAVFVNGKELSPDEASEINPTDYRTIKHFRDENRNRMVTEYYTKLMQSDSSDGISVEDVSFRKN